jgi:hypothetical protein
VSAESVAVDSVRVLVVALAGVLLALACMEAPREQRTAQRARGEPAGVAPVAPKPVPAARARPPRPSPQPVEEPIDPALVPVEEDFRGDVEQRIHRRTDLELELQRVSRELTKRE